MKTWQEFLLWGVCFCLTGASFELIKSLSDTGLLNKWAFSLIVFIVFIFGWVGVFLGSKYLGCKTKKTEKKRCFMVWFVYFMLVWSVCMAFDVMTYSLENNMLNKWYFFVIGLIFLFIGWVSGQLDNIISGTQKQK